MLRSLALLLLLQSAAWGWGRDGHALIGRIAERHLTPEARAAVARLLEDGETLSSIGSWADEIRNERRETSTWHYINLPITQPRGDWRAYCPASGCVVSVIPDMMARLRDRSRSRAERAEALKFLTHFVGDLHQPLHTGDRGDRGGNDVPVVFRDRPGNLHSIWDTPILLWMFERDPGLRARLERGAGYWQRRRIERGTLDDWAWEAHAVARDVVYHHLPDGNPALLGEHYARQAAPAVELQVMRAGVRLARLLNEVFGAQ
ncbi:MAG: S1/P1 nuclease [Bryobacteraceae bacterium]|nr:S1/P1 nuclease [Bryobacteraceae bacterium]